MRNQRPARDVPATGTFGNREGGRRTREGLPGRVPRTRLPALPSDPGSVAAQARLVPTAGAPLLGEGWGSSAEAPSPGEPAPPPGSSEWRLGKGLRRSRRNAQRRPPGRPVAGAGRGRAGGQQSSRRRRRERQARTPQPGPAPSPAHAAPLRTCCARPPPFSRASPSQAAPPLPGARLRHRADLGPDPTSAPRRSGRAIARRARRRVTGGGRGLTRKGRANLRAAASRRRRFRGRADLRPRAARARASQ